MRGLCREVSTSTVTRTSRSPAIESNHQLFAWVLPPLVISPFGAHARPPALPTPIFMPIVARARAPLTGSNFAAFAKLRAWLGFAPFTTPNAWLPPSVRGANSGRRRQTTQTDRLSYWTASDRLLWLGTPPMDRITGTEGPDLTPVGTTASNWMSPAMAPGAGPA